jgi:hypothetical protein
MNGEDEEFAHGANASSPARACKTARCGRIASHYEFATHTVQDEILSFDRPLGSDRNQRQAEKVGQQQQNDPSKGDHARIMPLQRVGSSAESTGSNFADHSASLV